MIMKKIDKKMLIQNYYEFNLIIYLIYNSAK